MTIPEYLFAGLGLIIGLNFTIIITFICYDTCRDVLRG